MTYKCWAFHSWELVRTTSAIRYYKCKHCTATTYTEIYKVHREIDVRPNKKQVKEFNNE